MLKRFQRQVENFVCSNCGQEVLGNGYTDHCPVCLWGKHVDINPGDRAADCGGAMEPVAARVLGGGYKIDYRCQKCGYFYSVKSAPEDNIEKIIELSARPRPLKK